MNTLFMSAPYPGEKMTYPGHPTGLLYALTVLAKRKQSQGLNESQIAQQIPVLCLPSTPDFTTSDIYESLRQRIQDQKPALLGISTFSASYRNATHIHNLAKSIDSDIITIFGGAHEDNSIANYRKTGHIDADFVVGGNGMYVLDLLHNLIEQGYNTPKKLKTYLSEHKEVVETLPGNAALLFNQEQSLQTIISNNKPASLSDVALMPRYLIESREKVDFAFPIFPQKKATQMMLGEGCPYTCQFCSEGIKKVFFDTNAEQSKEPLRTIEHVREELNDISARGYNAIFFDDSTFFAKPIQYLAQVFNELEQRNIEWACQTTVGTLAFRPELVRDAANAGCTYMYFGLEHTVDSLVDSFGGKQKLKGGIENVLNHLQNNNVRAGLSLTFGHPNNDDPNHRTLETKETAKQAIDALAELISKYSCITAVSCNLVTYHPGTPMSINAEKKGVALDYTGLPNNTKPFTHFEEGMGPHPAGVNSELVSFVYNYAKQKLGNKLLME